MNRRQNWSGSSYGAILAGWVCAWGIATPCVASNHLDTSLVIANPQANIGDIFAWTAADGRHLNLVMDIVGHSFSDKLAYVFHVDSSAHFPDTAATTAIVCRFPQREIVNCRLGERDRASGDASSPDGLESYNRQFRVFAGLRDDPFFNNVRGTRAAYQVAKDALKAGAMSDGAGCPRFSADTAQSILYQWRHTDGGPATNFLAHWTTSALVLSVNLDAIDRGGKFLAVWAATETSARQFDRAGRPLSKNALIDEDAAKDAWNQATPATSARFAGDMAKSLAFYDGFDGVCGNQLLADQNATGPERYLPLARLLVDDRLWVNAASTSCTQLFAVELAALAGRDDLRGDCGGRTPLYNASNVWRSLLINGTVTGFDDGLDHDEHEPSATRFPFLAPPDAQAINH